MSEIETIMLVALGFAIAALIALFLGRFTWKFALGLGRRHTERAVPTTLAELKSDRDRLRAEYAMLSRKLDLRLTDLKTRLAEQMAEVSRNRNRIDHLQSEIRLRDGVIADREGELVTLKMQLGPLEQELASRTEATQQLKEILRRRDAEIARLGQAVDQLRGDVAQRDKHIATLNSDLADRKASGVVFSQESASLQNRLQSRLDDLASMSSQIEARRREIAEQFAEVEALRLGIAEAKADAEDEAPLSGEIIDPASEIFEDTRIATLDDGTREIEARLQAAVKETDVLAGELRELDRKFEADLARLDQGPAPGTAPRAPEPPPAPAVDAAVEDSRPRPPQARPLRGVANVIQLAARIRGMQKNAGGSS